jgi:hypothetical protein
MFVFFHDALGSYLHVALQAGGAAVVACPPTPRAKASLPPSPLAFLMDSTVIFVIHVN